MKKLHPISERIANDIVAVVEKTGGPVTLARIARKVPGFEQTGAYSWRYEVDDTLVWDQMTEEGWKALEAVILEGRVAQRMASTSAYLLDGRRPTSPNWMPIYLVPKALANFRLRGALISESEEVLKHFEAVAAARREQGLPCDDVGRC
jgi:hypothetical protein